MPEIDVIELAARFIQLIEGLKLTAYQDATGTWTIGFGHTKTACKGMVITRERAYELFRLDVAELLLPDLLTQPVIAGAVLLSFGFNCGLGAMTRVLTGDIKVTAEGFVTPDGKLYGTTSKHMYMSGLDARRRLEAGLAIAGGFSR